MGYCDSKGVCHEDDCECEACIETALKGPKYLSPISQNTWKAVKEIQASLEAMEDGKLISAKIPDNFGPED